MERTTLTERLRRVEAEIAANRPEQALAYCQELQTAYPRALRVQRVLGEIYLALRRPREALAALDRALMGDPEDVRACCARALVHQMHGDNVAALAWYRRACDLRPQDQTLRATYRDLALRLGQPPYRPSRAGLARLYLRGDLFAHAIREWEQVVAESPDMLDAQVGLAETLWLAGHARAAEERCRRILSNAPSCVKAMLIQMALALADGDMDTARAHLERTVQLDPDRAIAQMVFADALASGDPVMIALLQPGASSEQPAEVVTGRPAAGFAQSGSRSGQRNLSRPLVTSTPTTGGATHNQPPSAEPLSQPLRPDVPVPSQPTEVTRAFRETAFMIWGQDDDNQANPPTQQPGSAGDTGWNAPPVLRNLRGVLNDEETQRALNWYNWLQAQGAVTLGAAAASSPPPPPVPPPPSAAERSQGISAPRPEAGPARVSEYEDTPTAPQAAAPAPPSTPAAENQPPAAPGGSPKLTMPVPPQSSTRQTMPFKPADLEQLEDGALSDGEPETVPLPLPPADALRTMFAELGGTTDNAGIASGEAEEDMPAAPVDQAAVERAEPDHNADDLSGSLWPAAANVANRSGDDWQDNMHAATQETYEAYDDALAAESNDSEAQPPEQPWHAEPTLDEEQEEPKPQTLEDLERQFSASGFTLIETHPGLLAEIKRAEQSGFAVAPQEQPPVAQGTPAGEPETPETPEHDTAEPAPSETIPSGPNPKDYPARLAHAQQRRNEGQLDDALNEYRAIIKNAPDLLPEVLSDLKASLEELPDHPNLHSVLGDALVAQGQYEQALEAYNRATALAQARSNQG